MSDKGDQTGDLAIAFEVAFARLQVLFEAACAVKGPWPERVTTTLREALEFAAANPDTVRALTDRGTTQGVDGREPYERLMGHLAGLLEPGRTEQPGCADLPAGLERSLVGGALTIVAYRVERGGADDLPRLLPELVQLVLTPYLGPTEAIRLATAADQRDAKQ